MSDDMLSDTIKLLIEARKERQENQLLEMKSVLVRGDIVEFYHSGQGIYVRGTVSKVKTKKALVIEEGHSSGPAMTWDVPMGMLKKVGDPDTGEA